MKFPNLLIDNANHTDNYNRSALNEHDVTSYGYITPWRDDQRWIRVAWRRNFGRIGQRVRLRPAVFRAAHRDTVRKNPCTPKGNQVKPCPICQMARRLDKGAKWGKPGLGVTRSPIVGLLYSVSCHKCGLGDPKTFFFRKDARECWNELATMIGEALRTAGTWCGPLTKAVRR